MRSRLAATVERLRAEPPDHQKGLYVAQRNIGFGKVDDAVLRTLLTLGPEGVVDGPASLSLGGKHG